jgi:hypothetical protein
MDTLCLLSTGMGQKGAVVLPGLGQVRIITPSNGCHLYRVVIFDLGDMIYHFSE